MKRDRKGRFRKQPEWPGTLRALAVAALLAAALITAGIYSDARAQGTPAERAACTPDAFRLCLSAALTFNAHGVTNCLIANKHRLSPTCRAVFTAHHVF